VEKPWNEGDFLFYLLDLGIELQKWKSLFLGGFSHPFQIIKIK